MTTPGPWKVELNAEGEPVAIVRDNGEESVECACPECRKQSWGGRTYSELVTCDSHVYGPTLQDAYVIAAAPELLEILEAILDDESTEMLETLHERAESVIAKARNASRR